MVLRQVVHDPGLLNAKFLNELLVPDSSLELHPLPRVLINDASWMVPRIESQKASSRTVYTSDHTVGGLLIFKFLFFMKRRTLEEDTNSVQALR